MLSGLDLEVVGISEVAEDFCLACARKKYGSLRVERIMVGLESHNWHEGPRAYTRYQADEDARDRGYDCGCGAELEFCTDCAAITCYDCGKRLDTAGDEPRDERERSNALDARRKSFTAGS